MQKTLLLQDEKFMRQALIEARQALDAGEFPVGCILVQDNKIIGRGRRRNSVGACTNEIDHAEMVTLRTLLAEQPAIDCQEITVYSTLEPCLMCYSTLLFSGIRRFVWAYEDVMGGGTNLPLQQLAPLYRDMRVELVPDVLRKESLSLFARFFERYSYHQDSLLAEYTLVQIQQYRSRLKDSTVYNII
ncbi:nucleoside deaminase [Desulfobulbus sp. US1]|nr:nucleoside deaminase [Desulfobulbus sp. US4]MCW5209198.1 nucleoside deaminase [Desulfobulbus sp. US1]